MIRTALFLILVGTHAAAQCPSTDEDGARFFASGPDLISPESWDVVADGVHGAPCDGWVAQGVAGDQVDGFLPTSPTAIFELDGMAPHILMVMADAQCSPRLVVRTGDGIWHFGEHANGRQEVTVWGTPDGPMQVWVGAEEQTQCEATLTLETFDR